MAFVWTSVSAGDIHKAAHVNEVKTNTDLLADGLSISHYSWSNMPVASGAPTKAIQITELQDALDYIDDNNTCGAENAVEYTTDNPDHDTGADGTKYNTVDVDQHYLYNSSNRIGR